MQELPILSCVIGENGVLGMVRGSKITKTKICADFILFWCGKTGELGANNKGKERI